MKRRVIYLALLAGAAVAIALLAVSIFAGTDEEKDTLANSGAAVRGSVAVNFEGSGVTHAPISQKFEVEPGASGWDAIKKAIGENKVTYQDFGGDLGILITGFDGVTLSGNRFWEFRVNGASSDVGVSTYKVKDGDMLEFRVSTF